jgi:hypothetical protein
VPEAETKVHHVFLCEGASFPQRTNTAPEKQAEAWKVCRHQGATLGAGGHPDHGSKCRKRLQGLQRNPNGATMVRMVAKLCVVLSGLLVASLGGCSGGNQAGSYPDASAVAGGSAGSGGTGGGGIGGQLATTTSAAPGVCVPGASVACACVTGQQGAQTCTAAGTFAACVCTAPGTDARMDVLAAEPAPEPSVEPTTSPGVELGPEPAVEPGIAIHGEPALEPRPESGTETRGETGPESAPDPRPEAPDAGRDATTAADAASAPDVPAPFDTAPDAARPTPLSQISAGVSHACGLRTDGTIACWGTNFYGESTPPSGTFTQISAGPSYTCAVSGGGSIV